MEWVPTVFIAFKVIVLAIGMFYAVKWHYDKGRLKGTETQRAMLRSGGRMAVVFVLLLAVLLFATFSVGRMLGLDLS